MTEATFRYFNELRPEEVNFDFHMHTSQTDGKHTAPQMIAAAADLGLTAIGFTEHVNRSSSWYDQFKAGIAAVRDESPIRVYIGIEAKPVDFEGMIDASPDTLGAAELIVGSVHRFPARSGGYVPLGEIPSLGAEQTVKIELSLALGLLRNRANRIQVLGHPMGISTRFYGGFPHAAMKDLMVACRENGVAFEISTKYCTDLEQLVLLLRETNPLVSIGSDAHASDEIGRNFPQLRDEMVR